MAAYIGNLLQGNGSVVEITGLAGSTPAIERHEGFLKGMAAYPGIRLLATSEGAWLRRQASEKMEALLDSFPHIDVVLRRTIEWRQVPMRRHSASNVPGK